MRSRIPIPSLPALLLTLTLAACAGEAPESGASDNPEAVAAFEHGNELWAGATRAQREEAIAEYERAVELDPEFTMAHAYLAEGLAWAHQNWDRSSEVASQALLAAQRAVELDPDEAAAHASLGAYHYRVAKDYPAALDAYSRATELAPEDERTLRMTGYVARRAGDFDEALARLLEADAISATPASVRELALTYRMMGRFEDAEAQLHRALEMDPDAVATKGALAWFDMQARADLAGVRSFLAEYPEGYVGNRWYVAMVDGDLEGALEALEIPGSDPLVGQYGIRPRSLMAGLTYTRMGDAEQAQASFQAARETMEALVAEGPDDPRTHLGLGLALAGLGMKEEAIASGRTGVELLPPERDALVGPQSVWWLAEICATAGDTDAAVQEIERLASLPVGYSPPAILMDPWLQEIIDDPRLQGLASSE
jgi:tetratricopeptide (TPR) repeat protein